MSLMASRGGQTLTSLKVAGQTQTVLGTRTVTREAEQGSHETATWLALSRFASLVLQKVEMRARRILETHFAHLSDY